MDVKYQNAPINAECFVIYMKMCDAPLLQIGCQWKNNFYLCNGVINVPLTEKESHTAKASYSIGYFFLTIILCIDELLTLRPRTY